MSESTQSRTTKHIDESFDENSPRPPVPGEERAHCASSDYAQQMEWAQYKASSPTPRKGTSEMGYEPEGHSKSHHERNNTTLLACLLWASSLDQLLADIDGVELFQKYLKLEGLKEYSDALDFWFACRGLVNQEEAKIKQAIKKIYSTYIKKNAFPFPEELRKRVSRDVRRVTTSSVGVENPVTIFEEAQTLVKTRISNTTYPNFLKSDTYLNYIQEELHKSTTGGEDAASDTSSSGSCISAKDLPCLGVSVGLPTLHEDKEFLSSFSAPVSHTSGTCCTSTGYHTPNVAGPIRLTKDMLLATESRRLDVRPKPEAFASKFLNRTVHYGIYNSYNPVTRLGSEVQSISSHSDVRTESDNLSMKDSSADERSSFRFSRRSMLQAQEQAAMNRNMDQFIPRTQRLEEKRPDMNDPEVQALLIKKLEKVKREREQKLQQDPLFRKLRECESINSLEKLTLEDDNDQDILDKHVSRVFADNSPGLVSPRPHSSSKNRYYSDSYNRSKRKDKDGFSTFSSDSGNVHDFWDSTEHRLNMVKSKSMEDRDKLTRGLSNRRSSSRRNTDLTPFDSGVSVVSDSHSIPQEAKDLNMLSGWSKKVERSERELGFSHRELGKHSRHLTGNLEPAHPFVADPNMPPLPFPNTSIQLEEARRRLDDMRKKVPSKHVPEVTRSGQSTLHKHSKGKSVPEDYTAVVFTFWDEELPYLLKIPGRQITLKQLKENLPKKGNYRYFFKTECEELDNQVIQEEVRNDSEVVPLFDGKIMAQAKPVDGISRYVPIP